MKIKKLGILLGVSSLLLLGACSNDSEEGKVVYELGNDKYTETEMFDDIKFSTGDSLLRQVITADILLNKFDVSDEQIKEKREALEAEYESAGGLDYQLNLMGMTEEQFEKQLKTEVAHDLVLKEMNNVNEKSIKERYEAIKEGQKVIHVMSMDKEITENTKKALEEGKSYEEVEKLITDESSVIEEATLIEGQIPSYLVEVFEMKKGEVRAIDTITGTHVIKVVGTEVVEFDELKASIEQELMYAGVESLDDVFKYLVDTYDVKLTGDYEYLLIEEDEETKE